MIQFEFATASRIIFGPGALADVGGLAANLGRRALVVTGSDATRASALLDYLTHAQVSFATFTVVGEPTTDTARVGAQKASRERCELIIGFGGGSVIDAGKAIAALLTNGGEPLDYLEVIGRGQPLTKPSAPYIAIPTTAGTGAEVTRNAVLQSPEHRLKASLRSPFMLPTVALIDPDLTHSLPPALTASTGLDALTQVIEPYVSNLANPLTDALCLDGISRAARSLRRVFANGADVHAREDMALVSLYGGLALANARLGAVHGFAGPFGGMFDAPHGAVCAALLPHVMQMNVRALLARQPQSDALTRYQEIAELVTGNPEATPFDAVVWVQELCRDLRVPSLGAYGFTEKDFPMLIENAQKASSMKGNPIKLTPAELQEILEQAF